MLTGPDHSGASIGRARLAMAARSAHPISRGLAILTSAICAVCVLGVAAGSARAAPPPPLSVTGAVLYAPATGQILYGVHPDRELAIASTTKLMTALLTLEHERHLGTIFAAPDYYASSADSQIGLVPGERMSVHDLLLALLIPSADDAAVDLAYNVGGRSIGHFIGEMNVRARQLGLTQTHYSTPSGLDTPGNYSSASDLVKLAAYLLKTSPYFKRVVDMPHAVLRTGDHVRYVVNRNDLVGRVPWINGVKTGHTNDAGYVLVGSGAQHGLTLLSTVLGTDSEESRDANTLALLDYGFANFHSVTPVTKGMVLARPTVKDRPGFHAKVIAGASLTRVLAKGTVVHTRVQLPRQLAGPLRRHAVVGTVIVLAGGKTVARIPLLLAQRLPAVSPLALAARFITRPFTLLIVLLLLGSAIGLAIRRRGHRHTRSGEIELTR
jgi:D-alanyl-D-alanine carboxypeptidase (penicillin-binding protein 5/6)